MERDFSCSISRLRRLRGVSKQKGGYKLFPNMEHAIVATMVMKIVGRSRLQDFCSKHPSTRSWVQSWLAECAGATWKTSFDIKARYSSASFLGNNFVIFNVKGNDYRLVTQIAYKTGTVVVKWVGTHQAYSALNWEAVKQ